jgi:signal transduction histidine kinase
MPAMSADPHPHIDLREPLPGEVLRRVSRGLAAYRNYPVFSWPWLGKRTLLIALAVGSLGVLSGLGAYADRRDPRAALSVALNLTLAFVLIATLGPLLATVVRHRGFRFRTERVLVLLALLVGMGASFFADAFASGEIRRGLGQKPAPAAVETVRPATAPSPALGALNVVVLVLVYGILGGGLAMRSYLTEHRRLAEARRERELVELRAQKQSVDMRLGVLQAQIEPHFLFNTLASVRSLVAVDPVRAASTIDALVDYLRATIPRLRDGAAQMDSTLGQQLEICDSYLKLMQVRMGNRLRYEIDLDPALRARAFPPLLLINLVENAVKHGIEPKAGPGHIWLRARSDAQSLEVSVSDDGVGLGDGFGDGVGLRNVREQLRARYGPGASCSLSRRPDTGTVARIVVPAEAEA